MAGPTATVLRQKALAASERESLLDLIRTLDPRATWHGNLIEFQVSAGTRLGVSVPVGGLPFSVKLDRPDDEPMGELVALEVGFRPVQEVLVVAYCNGSADHLFLANFCAEVASRFGGVIDFGGPLDGGAPLHFEGQLLDVPYEAVDGSLASNHIGDVAFLRWWTKQSSFRMVK